MKLEDATHVWTSGATERGKIVGERKCMLEGCRAYCLGVRWKNGKLTWPCKRGMFVRKDGNWQIEL